MTPRPQPLELRERLDAASKACRMGDLPELLQALGPEAPSALFELPDANALLAIAALAESLPCVQALLRFGARADLPGDWCPLSIAALSGQPDICRALLAAGADPNEPGARQAVSALNRACALREIDTLLVFLHFGVDPNAHDARGIAPLSCAVSIEHAAALLQYGADPAALPLSGSTHESSARSRGFPSLADFLASAAIQAELSSELPHAMLAPRPRL